MEMEMEQQERREWDTLPSSALVNIFCKSSIKDRIFNLPLVCKSWSQACCHPHCWASMVAAVEDDEAFLKVSYPYEHIFVDPFDGRRCSDPTNGVKALHGLIRRAAGGAAVTSIYFFPFLTSADNGDINDDALLHLIAQHCPNLKRISFHGSSGASEQAISELLHRCKKLELVDFSDSPYFIPFILEKMSINCLNLRGIRRNGELQPSFASRFTKCFPSLKLLNLSDSTIVDKDLLMIVTSFRRLEYLDIKRCGRLLYYMYIIKGASSIGEIIYD